MTNFRSFVASVGCVALIISLMAVNAVQAEENIGETSAVANEVTGELDENLRQLVVGDHVFQNEWIETKVESSAELMFIDETMIEFGPQSRIRLDTFVFDPDPSLGKVIVNMTQGVFRFVTGSMRSAAYEIRTPAAIIGVRGTEFELIIDPVTKATTVKLISGVVMLTSCPEAAESDDDIDDPDCTGGVTQVLDEPGLVSTVSGDGDAPTEPVAADQAFNDLVEQMDELIIAAIAEQTVPAAGGPNEQTAFEPLTVDPPSFSATVEQPSIISASPAS